MIAGIDGPVALISAETAYILEKRFGADMSRLRVAARGRNQRVAQELHDLRDAAMRWDPKGSAVPELEPDLEADSAWSEQWLTPLGVADLLGLTDRGVRKACAEGRLEAEQDHRRQWHITRRAAEEFDRTRNQIEEQD